MSDLFHEKVTDEMLDKAFAVMALTPQHTYQILTKRPERMREYFEKAKGTPAGTLKPEFWRRWHVWKEMRNLPNGINRHFAWGVGDHEPQIRGNWPLPNIWLGVSVEDQKSLERIMHLRECPAAVQWISIEPLLEDLGQIRGYLEQLRNPWAVVGGESGSNARPFDIAWARSIIDQCKATDVPVFIKQLGAKPYETFNGTGSALVSLHSRKGGDIDEWPEDLQVREYPAR